MKKKGSSALHYVVGLLACAILAMPMAVVSSYVGKYIQHVVFPYSLPDPYVISVVVGLSAIVFVVIIIMFIIAMIVLTPYLIIRLGSYIISRFRRIK